MYVFGRNLRIYASGTKDGRKKFCMWITSEFCMKRIKQGFALNSSILIITLPNEW
jgi:hypothetical protein